MDCLDDDFSPLSRRVDFSYISSSINKFYDDDCIWRKIMFSSRSLRLVVKVKKRPKKDEPSRCFTFLSRMDHKISAFCNSDCHTFCAKTANASWSHCELWRRSGDEFSSRVERLCVFAYFYVLILPVTAIYASVSLTRRTRRNC